MSSHQQHVQSRLGGNQDYNDADIVQNAWSRGIAHHRVNVLRRYAVDDGLHGRARRGGVHEVYVVTTLDSHAGGMRQPLWIVKSSALGYRGAALFSRVP